MTQWLYINQEIRNRVYVSENVYVVLRNSLYAGLGQRNSKMLRPADGFGNTGPSYETIAQYHKQIMAMASDIMHLAGSDHLEMPAIPSCLFGTQYER